MEKTAIKSNVHNLRTAVYEMFGIGHSEETLPAIRPITAAAEVEEAVEEEKMEPILAAPYTTRPVSFLSPDTVWEGTLQSEGDVDVAGRFRGDITSRGCVTLHADVEGNVAAERLVLQGCTLTGDVNVSGTVVIDRDSCIQGSVTAQEVRCAGRVQGDMQADGAVMLESTAAVEGNICTGSICVSQGASLRGAVESKKCS